MTENNKSIIRTEVNGVPVKLRKNTRRHLNDKWKSHWEMFSKGPYYINGITNLHSWVQGKGSKYQWRYDNYPGPHLKLEGPVWNSEYIKISIGETIYYFTPESLRIFI